MGGLGTWHQPHLGKCQGIFQFQRGAEMTDMYRIKGAAKQTNTVQLRRLGHIAAVLLLANFAVAEHNPFL
jgi:hypothetical protein